MCIRDRYTSGGYPPGRGWSHLSPSSGAAVLEDSSPLSFADCSTILLSCDNSVSRRFQLESPGSTTLVMTEAGSSSDREQRAIGSVPNPDFLAVTPWGNTNPCNCCLVLRFDFSQTEARSPRIPRPYLRTSGVSRADSATSASRHFKASSSIEVLPSHSFTISSGITPLRHFSMIASFSSFKDATLALNLLVSFLTHFRLASRFPSTAKLSASIHSLSRLSPRSSCTNQLPNASLGNRDFPQLEHE